jgi:hypothetical protein
VITQRASAAVDHRPERPTGPLLQVETAVSNRRILRRQVLRRDLVDLRQG